MLQDTAEGLGLPRFIDWNQHSERLQGTCFEEIPESDLEDETILRQAEDVVAAYRLTENSEAELVSFLWYPSWYATCFAACATVTRAAAILALKIKKGQANELLGVDDWHLDDYGHCRAANKVRREQKSFLETDEDQPYRNWKFRQGFSGQWMMRAQRRMHRACKALDYWGWKALEESGDVQGRVSQFVGDEESFKSLNGGVWTQEDYFYTNEEVVDQLDAAQEDAMDEDLAKVTPGVFGMTDAERIAYEQEWVSDWNRPDIDTADIRAWDDTSPGRWSSGDDWDAISGEGLLNRYGIYWKEPSCGCCGPHWVQDGKRMWQTSRGYDWEDRWSSWDDLYEDRMEDRQFFKWLMAWRRHAEVALPNGGRY